MPGQMCWLSRFGASDEKILHLRKEPHHPWTPYTSMPAHSVPDYRIPGGSKGWATFQKLLRDGWIMIPTSEARKLVLTK